MSHIILLLQTTTDAKSRTYLDFTGIGKACSVIVNMYEERLKVLTPGSKQITYDVQDLFRYLDNIHDISGLRLNGTVYEPMSKEDLKVAVYNHLKGQASR